MSSTSSVIEWLEAARSGDNAAVERLWKQFSRRMRELARKWLAGIAEAPPYLDASDVTAVAFTSFQQALAQGAYEEVDGSHALWQLLATITLNKARDQLESELAQKRGGRVHIYSIDDSDAHEHASPDPTPEFAAMMTDECRRLLALLDDPELEAIALERLHGANNAEIGKQLNYSRRTIQRMLNAIRDRWREELD